jgi:hypothetical protein
MILILIFINKPKNTFFNYFFLFLEKLKSNIWKISVNNGFLFITVIFIINSLELMLHLSKEKWLESAKKMKYYFKLLYLN